jgi:signal peptidase I
MNCPLILAITQQQRRSRMKNQWGKQLSMFWRSWGYSLIITLLIATSFRSAIADLNDIPSGSMEPTILIGDRILVNKLAYDLKVPYTTWHLKKWSDPKRGDIVIFFSPKDGKRLVKRVVGLPGDTVAMHQNQLYINEQFVKYEPLDKEIIDQIDLDQKSHHLFFKESLDPNNHPVMLTPSSSSLNSFPSVNIPEGKYFMMGDNRDNSYDSRFFGFVDREHVVGRAIKVMISRKGSFLHPRWERFFKDLS